MIYGGPRYDVRDAYHVQTNNPTEEVLRKSGMKGWLETCGPTSAVNCIDALGLLPKTTLPGGYEPQAEEYLSDYLNDPANHPLFRTIRPGLDPASIPGGRVPQYYPIALEKVFGVKGAVYRDDLTFDKVKQWLKGGNAAMICLKSPGHYLAAVAFEEEASAIIVNDSWPERWKDGKGGFNRRHTFADWPNTQSFGILIPGGK